MQRICELIHVRPEAIAEYERIHAEVWPTVLSRLAASHITNYSIYLRRPENLLIAYYEYTGDDLAADQAAIAADPETQRWWKITDPMQQPLASMPATDGSAGRRLVGPHRRGLPPRLRRPDSRSVTSLAESRGGKRKGRGIPVGSRALRACSAGAER